MQSGGIRVKGRRAEVQDPHGEALVPTQSSPLRFPKSRGDLEIDQPSKTETYHPADLVPTWTEMSIPCHYTLPAQAKVNSFWRKIKSSRSYEGFLALNSIKKAGLSVLADSEPLNQR